MSGRGKVRSALLSAVASAFWLAGAGLPAHAAGQTNAGPFTSSGVAAIPEVTVEAPAMLPAMVSPLGVGTGADFVATAGLRQYAMSNHQLNTIRGGMEMPNGAILNFGFEQVTTVNGVVVSGILVQNGAASAYQGTLGTTACTACTSGTSVSYNVTNGKGTLSAPQGWSGTPITLTPGKTTTITGTANDGQTVVTTQFSPSGIYNDIGNIANNQLINQSTIMTFGVTGLAQSIAAEQAVNSAFNSVMRAVRGP